MLEGTRSALAWAHAHLLVALARRSTIDTATVSQLTADAVELLLAVASIRAPGGPGPEQRRGVLVEMLRQRLGSHEEAILAGEMTYAVTNEHAEEPAARVRQAITHLSADRRDHESDLLSLRIAAVHVAALLIRLAANAAASGHAGEAPQERSAALDARLSAVTTELAGHAQTTEPPIDERADVVAHHLAAGLRVRDAPDSAHPPDGAGSRTGTADSMDLGACRETWLRLATHEYVAVAALDAQRMQPIYQERVGGLSEAIAEAAANVLCGARLIDRPTAFAHRRAWRHQAVALTHALEAYVAGVRGDGPSLAHAQLITLTRLVRAAVAIVLIDLARDGTQTCNASPAH